MPILETRERQEKNQKERLERETRERETREKLERNQREARERDTRERLERIRERQRGDIELFRQLDDGQTDKQTN